METANFHLFAANRNGYSQLLFHQMSPSMSVSDYVQCLCKSVALSCQAWSLNLANAVKPMLYREADAVLWSQCCTGKLMLYHEADAVPWSQEDSAVPQSQEDIFWIDIVFVIVYKKNIYVCMKRNNILVQFISQPPLPPPIDKFLLDF